jgi:putative ABC transport system permease protein
MSHQLTYTTCVCKNLIHRKLRTALTLCGVGVAIAAFVCLVGFSSGFEQAWMRLYSGSGTDIAVVDQTFLSSSIDEGAAAKVRALPMVENAAPLIFNVMDLTQDVNALVYGWTADSYEMSSLKVQSGRLFHAGQAEVMLGDVLASNMKKSVGDTVEIQGTPFTVCAVVHGPSALEAGAVILPLDQLQTLSGLQGKVSTIHVRLKPPPAGVAQDVYVKQAEAVIEKALPGLRAVPAAERASNNQFVRLAHASAWGTSAVALLIGIMGIANTMAMSVFERTKEIGILRALGWKQWQVLLLIELEAGMLGVFGGVFGILLGIAALRVLALLPQTATVVSMSVPPVLVAEALVIAVMAGLLAGAAPAIRGAQLKPIEALRHD